MLDQCSEACGWVAGIIAALSFGTFGVPIKSAKAKLKVDPLVMQTYKSILCFLTCWLVIPLGEPFTFTPWGIVSGLFWVPGATAGIYGIQNAGLAISVGTWSSLIVISSFFWGILVFNEKVKSKFHALLASFVLILGLVGMSVYSAPVSDEEETISNDLEFGKLNLIRSDSESDNSLESNNLEQDKSSSEAHHLDTDNNSELEMIPLVRRDSNTSGGKITKRVKKTRKGNDQDDKKLKQTQVTYAKEEELVHFFGRFSLSKRQLGLIGAIINGVWGSNNMIPMHYARKDGFYGAGYLISYSVGSMIVTIFIWIIRYFINVYHYGEYGKALKALPSFHIQTLVGPGSLAGFLYSLGNFCSIITVTALGQGVGYSFVQTSMLISGLWGIFFFGEVKGSERMLKWIVSSLITLVGILALSYEHQGSSAH